MIFSSNSLKGQKFGILKYINSYSSCSCHGTLPNSTSLEVHTLSFTQEKEQAIKEAKSCGCRNERIGKNHPHYRGYEDISWDYWCKLQNGANRRNIRFEISIEDAWNLFVVQGKKCKLTGWDIELFSESKRKNTASLDRIDSNRSYTLDNVQWVHKDINKMKQNYSEEYFIKACKAIAKKVGVSLD